MRRGLGSWGSRGRTQRPRSTSSLWPGTMRRTGAYRKGGWSAYNRKQQPISSADCKGPSTGQPSWRNFSRRRRGRYSSYRRKPRASSPLKTWRRGLRSASTIPATTILPLTRKGGWPSKVSCLKDLAFEKQPFRRVTVLCPADRFTKSDQEWTLPSCIHQAAFIQTERHGSWV